MKTFSTLFTASLLLLTVTAKSQYVLNDLAPLNGMIDNNKVVLNWKAVENEKSERFEVEKSTDGINFIAAGLVFSSEKSGEENYIFSESLRPYKMMYRLKMYDKNQKEAYSKMVVFQAKATDKNNLKILNNPVPDDVVISYESTKNQPGEIKVFDANGSLKTTYKTSLLEGHNILTVPLSTNLKTGVYSVQLVDGTTSNPIKFVKL